MNLDSQQWVFYLFTYFLFHSGAETQFQMKRMTFGGLLEKEMVPEFGIFDGSLLQKV